MNRVFYKIIAALLMLTLVSCAASDEISDQYGDSVSNADVFINIPCLRQYGGYTCGTTCIQMVMNYLYPYEADINLASYEEELGTDEVNGTSPERIVSFLESEGAQVSAEENRSNEWLISTLDRRHPVIMCVQAWSADGTYNTSDKSREDTYLSEGHWIICVGYRRSDAGVRFYFNDPACVGHCYMDGSELDERWIDMSGDGKIYSRYGIEVSEDTVYDINGAFHLD